ncbi:MAG: hypothetical protein ACOCV2_09140, partial [Persicimonas sp.]
MKKLFLITDDADLQRSVEECAENLGAEVETQREWSEAREVLVKRRFDAVCLDYEAIKIEGLDAFILLDNILQKEQTPGVLISREVSERARQFISELDSFGESLELGDGTLSCEQLEPRLEQLLDEASSPSPAAAQSSVAEQTRVEVQVRLPSFGGGSLQNVDLGRLLYALYEADANGILHLKTDSMQRRYAVIEGAPVRNAGGRYDDLESLASA